MKIELCTYATGTSYTGVRFGEVAALRWDDVDLECATARIARSFLSDVELGHTNKRWR